MSYKNAAAKDFFSLELRDPQGVALQSVDYDAQRFWVVEPGMEFQVAVSASIRSGMTYQVGQERAPMLKAFCSFKACATLATTCTSGELTDNYCTLCRCNRFCWRLMDR